MKRYSVGGVRLGRDRHENGFYRGSDTLTDSHESSDWGLPYRPRTIEGRR